MADRSIDIGGKIWQIDYVSPRCIDRRLSVAGNSQSAQYTLSDAQQPAIAFAADDKPAVLLAVALYSALRHLSADLQPRIFIIDGGISAENRQRLAAVAARISPQANLSFVRPEPELLAPLAMQTTGEPLAYFLDLFLGDVLAKDLSRVIYLDCDLLVRHDLSILWQIDLEGRMLGAVRSLGIPMVASPGGVTNYAEFGLPGDAPYFNSGVMVIDLDRWRRERTRSRVVEALLKSQEQRRDIKRHLAATVADQFALNAVLATDWVELDPRWNVEAIIVNGLAWQTAESRAHLHCLREQLLYGAWIYHFTGPKPDRLDCALPAKILWYRYLAESGWFSAHFDKDPVIPP
jgi:lipopolysaccharide biosynthesis glycosyltransferase